MKESAAKTDAPRRENRERPQKLSFKERKEYEALSVEIEELTDEKTRLEALFNSGENIPDIADKAMRYNEVKELLDDKELRWLELDERS